MVADEPDGVQHNFADALRRIAVQAGFHGWSEPSVVRESLALVGEIVFGHARARGHGGGGSAALAVVRVAVGERFLGKAVGGKQDALAVADLRQPFGERFDQQRLVVVAPGPDDFRGHARRARRFPGAADVQAHAQFGVLGRKGDGGEAFHAGRANRIHGFGDEGMPIAHAAKHGHAQDAFERRGLGARPGEQGRRSADGLIAAAHLLQHFGGGGPAAAHEREVTLDILQAFRRSVGEQQEALSWRLGSHNLDAETQRRGEEQK